MAVKVKKSDERLDKACEVEEACYRAIMEDRLEKINECFLSFGPNPDENINRLVGLCGRLLNGACAIYNRLEDGMFYSVGKWNTPSDYNPPNEPRGYLCYDVIMRKSPEPFIVRNLQDSSYAKTDPNVILYKLKTYIGMAVKFDSTYIGSLCVVFQKDFAPSAQEIKFMAIIASAIGVEESRRQSQQALVKSNKKLKQLALIDSHTGLYNHKYLEEVIETEFYRSRRCAHALSVIMLDTDYFKSINDVYGYQFGDLILKQLARQLKVMVRRYDILARFGGEEFVIVCPCTGREQVLTLAQRLLDAVNLYNFGDAKQIVKLKLSLAAVSYPEDNAAKGMDLINIASEILNRAKESGGNRVYSSLDMKKKKPGGLDKNGKNENVKLLRGKLDKLTKRSNQSLIEAIFAFAKTIELKDRYTGEHVEKTVHYATEIARDLGLTREDLESIRKGAMLHDLGKIGISEKILLKRAKLSKEEFEIIKKHPQIGVDIIRPIQFLHNIIPLMLYHHERWDGKGYPSGLKGEEIPIGARIIAIADVYQALTSDRPYRKAFTKNKALDIIKGGSGTQFDPRIAQAFLKIVEKK